MSNDTYFFVVLAGIFASLLVIWFLEIGNVRRDFRKHENHGSLTRCKLCYTTSSCRDYNCRWPEGNQTGMWEYKVDRV